MIWGHDPIRRGHISPCNNAGPHGGAMTFRSWLRLTAWPSDAGVPISSRVASQPFETSVVAFKQAANRTFDGSRLRAPSPLRSTPSILAATCRRSSQMSSRNRRRSPAVDYVVTRPFVSEPEFTSHADSATQGNGSRRHLQAPGLPESWVTKPSTFLNNSPHGTLTSSMLQGEM